MDYNTKLDQLEQRVESTKASVQAAATLLEGATDRFSLRLPCQSGQFSSQLLDLVVLDVQRHVFTPW